MPPPKKSLPMLPGLLLPVSLLVLLENLRWVFTATSFVTFTALATGLIANTARVR